MVQVAAGSPAYILAGRRKERKRHTSLILNSFTESHKTFHYIILARYTYTKKVGKHSYLDSTGSAENQASATVGKEKNRYWEAAGSFS